MEAVVAEYETAYDRIAERGLDAEVSLKPSHLGLDLSREVAAASLERLAKTAADGGNWLCSSGFRQGAGPRHPRARGRVGLRTRSSVRGPRSCVFGRFSLTRDPTPVPRRRRAPAPGDRETRQERREQRGGGDPGARARPLSTGPLDRPRRRGRGGGAHRLKDDPLNARCCAEPGVPSERRHTRPHPRRGASRRQASHPTTGRRPTLVTSPSAGPRPR